MVARSPLVSILIPVLNEAEHLGHALEVARSQNLPGQVEILAIDGGSRDGSREILAQASTEDPRVRVLENPAQTVPHALNIGLRAANGIHVARMDAHTRYPRDYLARGVARLQRGDAASVSGPQLAAGEGGWSRRIALALTTPLGIGGARFRRLQDEVEVDSGFTGVWRRATLLNHGGWDEDWPVNEDAELAARMRAAGGRILCIPGMAASYVPRDSLRSLARQYWRYGQYRAKTLGRHPESMRRSHLLPPAIVVALMAATLRGPQRPLARVGIATWLVALAVIGVEQPRRSGHPSDAAAVPLVLVTLHVTWGLGFLVGCMRFGPPVAALVHLLRDMTRGRRSRSISTPRAVGARVATIASVRTGRRRPS